jgi:hypothetical protein
MTKKNPEAVFAKHRGKIRDPQRIEFDAWAALSPGERAPQRSVAMLELHDDHAHCLIVDTHEHQPLYIFAVEMARMAEVLRIINRSRPDGNTHVVVGGPRFTCPRFCLEQGIGDKADPGGGGPPGDDPGPLLLLRAKLIERALNTPMSKVKGDDAVEVEALVLRD